MRRRLRQLADDDESGSVLLLILGFGIVVLALTFVVASVSALHLERKQLQAATEAAVLDAASLLSEEAYYTSGTQEFQVDEGEVTERVGEYLGTYGEALGLDGARIVEVSVGEDGRTITVTLSARAAIPLVPTLVPGIADSIRVEATAISRGY